MGRLSLSLVAVVVAIAIATAELLSLPMPVLASSPWPWLGLAAVVALTRWKPPTPYILIGLLAIAQMSAQRSAFNAGNRRAAALPNQLVGTVSGPLAKTASGSRFTLRTARLRLLVVVIGPTADVGPGDRLSLWGNVANGPTYRTPGSSGASSDRQLRSTGHDAIVFARGSTIERLESGSASVWRLANFIQASASRSIRRRNGSERGNAIVRALAAGDRSGVDAPLAADLRRAGIAHLLAVSGLHIAVVSLFAFGVARRLWSLSATLCSMVEPRAFAAVIALLLASLYTLVTGARPSTLRALFVAALVFGGIASFRRPRALDCLGVAAALLLLHRPAILFDASFQMSFAAAVTLALAFAKRDRSDGTRAVLLFRRGRDLIVVAFLALVATAPTAISIHSELPIAGIVANVIAVPIVELIVLPLTLIGLGLSLVSPALGGLVLDAAISLAGWVASGAGVIADHCPPLWIPALSPLCVILLVVGLGAGVISVGVASKRARRQLRFLSLASAVCMTSLVALDRQRVIPTDLVATFIDVGQGDTTVLEFPAGEVWLIDGGGRAGAADPRAGASPGARSVVPFLRHRRISRIDVAVISHAHPDHYLGLAAIAGEIPIENVYIAAADPDQPRPGDLLAILDEIRAAGGEVGPPPKERRVGEAQARFLAPLYQQSITVDPVSSVNDNSIALRVDFGTSSMLFAGDLEDEGEQLLIESGSDIDVDVLKVNHHGSGTSSTPAFVAATSPRVAVISCGRANRYGFPNPGVLARLIGAGAEIWRTDIHGTVEVRATRSGRILIDSFVHLPANHRR